VTPWIFFRWLLIGAYVGFATVGIFAAWYMFDTVLGIDLSGDGHSLVTWRQLSDWEECPTWEGFTVRCCPWTTTHSDLMMANYACCCSQGVWAPEWHLVVTMGLDVTKCEDACAGKQLHSRRQAGDL
jgi:hypothetical protein